MMAESSLTIQVKGLLILQDYLALVPGDQLDWAPPYPCGHAAVDLPGCIWQESQMQEGQRPVFLPARRVSHYMHLW